MLGEDFEDVLASARAGAQWAFARLYRDLSAPLLRYFAAQVPREAEDLASETWLGAAKGLHAFRGDERAFRAWLFSIAHRKLVQHVRDAVRRRAASRAASAFDAAAGSDDTEAEALAAIDAVGAARRLAAALPPDQAQVVLLRVLAGLSVDEVAAVLGKRPGTVRVLQHRALRRLAKAISLEGVTP